MNNLKFSIIIPTYNRADLIGKTIKSILNQTYTDFEIIVVDDGSTDDTEQVVLSIKDDKIKYFKKKNEERAVARNYGAKIANGEYVNFFDSDDIAFENHLDEANKLIDKHNKPAIFHLAYEWVTPEGKVFKTKNKFYGNINKQLVKANIFSCNGVFIRKDIILENLFNEDRELSASEDWELWLRLSVKYKWYFSNVVTSQIVDHDARSVLSINKENLIKRKELFLKYTLENSDVAKFIGKQKKKFIANAYSYVSLHLILAKYKRDGFKYYFKTIKQCPRFLFTRRNFAILKHLIIL